MTDAATIEHEPKLYLSDAELIQRIGLPQRRGRMILRSWEASGFPKRDKLLGDKRYWPAVKLFLDRKNRVIVDASPNHRGRP